MVNKFDPKLFNYNEYMEENSSVENIEAAFELAEKSLGVPKLLDVNELANGTTGSMQVSSPKPTARVHAFPAIISKDREHSWRKAA